VASDPRTAWIRRALPRERPGALLRRAAARGQEVITPAEPTYPANAFEGLDDPPRVLFVRGSLPAEGTPAVAIVGTRGASPYGLRSARELSEALGTAGICIVSGFAVGVDGAAHEGALAVGAPTLAVTGCGLDVDYPLAHLDLRERIAAAGALLSEHPPGTEPRAFHFPRRNRIVAALAQAVVVVEAPERSGALITARLALDLGREVLAMPGNVTRGSHAGCHRLLKQGAAALCEGPRDVLELLELAVPGQPDRGRGRPPPEGIGGTLWRALDEDEPLHANQVCTRTGLDATTVAATLTQLELEGRVRRLPGLGFVRC
jgi:DNA processing protein